MIGGTLTVVPASQVSLTASATNYVYLNLVTLAVAASTSGFPSSSLPIAVVATTISGVSTITDSRPDFLVSTS